MSPQALRILDRALPSLRDYAILLIDPAGMIVGWLGGAEEIFGYREQEIVGCHSSTLFVPEDVALGLDRFELEVAQRDSFSQDDRWHVRADRTRIWASGTVTAVREDSGALCGFVKILRDRTDLRMNTEHRLHQVEALEATLARTRNFLQTLGHELRNPLAPIMNSVNLLHLASDDPRVHKAAQTIANQVKALERVTGDLMDVSRLDQKKLALRLAELDIRALVDEEVAGQADRARAKGLRLEFLTPAQPLLLVADGDRVRQAVANLLSNAIKYTPEGGSVWVKVTREVDDIVVRVQDTGIGIAPDALPRIFGLFAREARARDVAPEGLGVGLAIVSQIAELHGGVAQARSNGIGKGSEFVIRLPCGGPGPDQPGSPG